MFCMSLENTFKRLPKATFHQSGKSWQFCFYYFSENEELALVQRNSEQKSLLLQPCWSNTYTRESKTISSASKKEVKPVKSSWHYKIYFKLAWGVEQLGLVRPLSPFLDLKWGFLGSSAVKNPPAMQEMQVQFLGQEDPLQEEMATHTYIFA